MTKRQKQNIGKAIGLGIYVVIILLLIGTIIYCGYYTNWYTTNFVDFYVSIDGKNILKDSDAVTLMGTSAKKVDVKYTFDWIYKDLMGYSLELSSNPNINFRYTVAEKQIDFQDLNVDWKQYFDIVENKKDFSISAKYDCIERIMCALYPDEEIIIPDLSRLKDVDIFLLTIYSKDKSSHITLGLRLCEGPTQISVEPSEIVF